MAEPAVQVPRVRVGEDDAVALAEEVADPVVVAAAPHLYHVVLLREVTVNDVSPGQVARPNHGAVLELLATVGLD